MSSKNTKVEESILKETKRWVGMFNSVPGSIIKKMADYDDEIACYDSDTFRLLASPRIECVACSSQYEGDLTLEQLQDNENVSCFYCEHNDGGEWAMSFPQYAFPCAWGTLFSPESCDLNWFKENADKVAKLGFFVFESDDFNILLGIDAGGFDFYEAYWIPLYKLRGLQWHVRAKG